MIAPSHKISFKVYGDRVEQLIVRFAEEETEDPFDQKYKYQVYDLQDESEDE